MMNEQKRSPGRPEKYPKTDFSDNLAEQARMISFIEDCDVRFVGKQIQVGKGTTHSTMLRLFMKLSVATVT